ncbi:glutathione S-transferase N-terminal domain-containing protein [Ahrensia sp. 13_GOM-1096m]|uniref:glutathione S-transferase N-terminal domain-containing protein n=1 Tax=Ahrensia sp. 13_GOM-1096m TaxID=1380380 RepID=UPI0004788E0E|nr:glutathione S-transferase N-terminal domain-containing protein [Ahrensia sp. 13_GOM-1096m]
MSIDATDHTLFDGGRAPNPRRVAIYLAERDINVTVKPVDMSALEHKSDSISALNPLKQLPLLQLPDGDVITESIAICRYFDALYPDGALFGKNPKEVAIFEMWQRRIELQLLFPVAQAFRHIHPGMKDWEVPQVPEWGEVNKAKAVRFSKLLNEHLTDNEFICGDDFTVADITGIIAVDFSKPARIAYDENLPHFSRWIEAVRSRPSYRR